MRRIRKPLIWIFSILLVLFVIFFIAASFYINSFKDDLEDILTDNIGLETRIDGNISLKVTPGLSFIAKDIKVISNETYVLKIDQAEISVDYMGMFSSSIDVSALRLEKPQVYIVRDTEGKFNYDSDRVATSSSDQDSDIHDFNLDKLEIRSGRLLYIDHNYNDTLMVDGLTLDSEQIGVKGSLSNIEVDKIMYNGTVEIDRIKVNGLVAEDMEFKIDGRGGKMAILPLNATYFGGQISGKTILDFTKTPALLQMQHQVTGFNIGNFGDAMHNKDVFEGKLNYKLDITFSSFNWSKAKQSLNGTVEIGGNDLLLRGLDMNKVLEQFEKTQQFNVVDLGALFVAGPYGAVFTKGISIAELLAENIGDSTQINTLVSNWMIKNGVAKTQDVAFGTDNYRMAMIGGLNFRTNNYENISISLINDDGCAAISQDINGSFDNPEIQSMSAIGKLSGPIDNLWNELKKPLRNPCAPVYKGSVAPPN